MASVVEVTLTDTKGRKRVTRIATKDQQLTVRWFIRLRCGSFAPRAQLYGLDLVAVSRDIEKLTSVLNLTVRDVACSCSRNFC